MYEDVKNGHPFIAALVTSRTRRGLPAPGFFVLAKRLGCIDGDMSAPDTAALYDNMFQSAVTFWRDRELAVRDEQ